MRASTSASQACGSRSLSFTVGDPEVVGAFANGLFQIWHGILLLWCAQPRQAKSCSRKVNEILPAGVGWIAWSDCDQQVSLKRVKNAAAAEGRACRRRSQLEWRIPAYPKILIGGSGNSAYNHRGGQATYSGVKAMRGGELPPEAGGALERARSRAGGIWRRWRKRGLLAS